MAVEPPTWEGTTREGGPPAVTSKMQYFAGEPWKPEEPPVDPPPEDPERARIAAILGV